MWVIANISLALTIYILNIHKYIHSCTAVYGEVDVVTRLEIKNVRVADTAVGVYVLMIGAGSFEHERVDKTVHIADALFVGFSDNGRCNASLPSLYTCSHFTVHCRHVGPFVSMLAFVCV
jgi:hypothetical protein